MKAIAMFTNNLNCIKNSKNSVDQSSNSYYDYNNLVHHFAKLHSDVSFPQEEEVSDS